MLLLKLLIAVVFLGWFLWFAYTNFDDAFGDDVAPQAAAPLCSEDIGICDDGTMVERSGPNCEFDACPH